MIEDSMIDETATMEPRQKRAAKSGGRVPCVGLPVQYHNGRDGVIPGILQRQGITEPELWDVKVFLNGAGTLVTRTSVRFSDVPREGCWSYLPGWRFES